MFGSSTNTGFGSFGTSQPAAPSSTTTTTPSLFGGAAPASTGSSLFGGATAPAPSTGSSLFGGSAPATSTASSLFGTAPTTSAGNSLFGQSTFIAPTTTTPSLFGGAAPATSSAPSLFGTSTTPASTTTSSLFGSTTTSAPLATSSSIPTNSLFGGQTTTTSNTSSLFQTPNNTLQQQRQQPQKQSLLDLNTCFPDTKVPHFVVTQTGLTRTTVPANFFHGSNTRDTTTNMTTTLKTDQKSREPLSTSLGFNERNTTLPNYLTSSENNNSGTSNSKSPINNFSSKKRVLEDTDNGRNVLAKSGTGVFTHKDSMTYGFEKNLTKQGKELPPVNSMKDVGVQSSVSQELVQRTEIEPTANNKQLVFLNGTSSTVMDTPNKTRVRVFGYTESNLQTIVDHFTKLGELAEPYVSQGNWITFNYTTYETALKAISCNGMNIDQNHLVGVTWDERAPEVENLHQQTIEQADLYRKNDGYMNIFTPNNKTQQQKLQQHQQETNEPRFFDKLKETLWGGW